MRIRFTAILLCVLAVAATAHSTTTTLPTAAATRQAAAPAPERPTGELIKAAGAATHDMQEVRPAPARAAHASGDGDEPVRSNGKAMLFTALAVMCGIALRRFTSRDQ